LLKPRTQSIADTAKELGIGINQAYTAAKHGELPVIRIGKRILVLREPLQRLIEEREAQALEKLRAAHEGDTVAA
jgi:hypothetical protein